MAYNLTLPSNKGGLYGNTAKNGFSSQVNPWITYQQRFALGRNKSLDPSLQKLSFSSYSPGTNLLKGGVDQNLAGGTDSMLTKDRQASNLRPIVDVLNYITASRKIGQIERTQLARKNMFYTAPSLSVRPVTDLPPEVLAAQADALSQVRSTEASSDPVMNLLSKNMATAQRGKMRNEQIAGRASAMLQDRNRFDTEMRQNQQLAGETANKNLDREQDFADYRTGVKTAALDARSKLNASTLSQLGQNIDTAAQYNLAAEAENLSNARQRYQDLLQKASIEPTQLGKETALKAAEDFYAPYTARLIPKFGQAQAMAIDNGFLTKLFRQRSR
jgi:hypothetical protein